MKFLSASLTDLKIAADLLKRGEVAVFPTDTTYGLGGLFDDKKVIKKILLIKGRTDTKFSLVASDGKQVERFFKLSPQAKKLAKKYWPGPLSIVVSRRYAVRVPDCRTTQTLARLVGRPLIASSANLTGQKPATSALAAKKVFAGRKHQPAAVVTVQGRLTSKPASTVIKVNKNQTIKVLRPGAIKL